MGFWGKLGELLGRFSVKHLQYMKHSKGHPFPYL